MAFNKDKYISKYIGEASENIATIESALFKLKDGNALEENLVYVLRTLHTLKSSSRMLEFINMESLVHSMENLFVAYKEERIKLTDKIVNLVLRSVDMLKTGIAHIQSGKSDSIEIQEYIGNLNNAAVNEDFVLPAANSEIKNDIKADTVCLPVHEKSAKANDILKEDSIRIPLHKIDQIIKDAASMQMLEMSSRNIHLEVDKMGQSLKNMNKIFSRKDFGSTASVKNDKEGLLIDFKEAEHVNSFLNSKIKNHVLDISQLVGKIYNSILSLRMLPISIILDSYPRYVYEMASGLNKKVKLVIKGKENEIDKNIIEGLSDILLHVIRNAVDHGIETPEERKKKGKDETGLLTIECSREHGNMKIVISDDGRGISEEKIRSKIIAMKLVDESIARSLSKTELINYIFESGFSTADQVSNISGRGVGMDVVKSKIEEMKGSISIDTEPDNGSKFNLVVPLSIASVLGFEVSAGNLKFIIPANYIETTMICTKEDFIENLNTPVIRYNNSMIKLFYLHQILETEKLKTS